MNKRFHFIKQQEKGATLIELIMTIVIISVAIAGVVGAFSLIVGRSADPLNQTRAVALSQLYMDEILSRNYDESSRVGGGRVDADDVDCVSSNAPNALGANGETRAGYDDVDDYHTIENEVPQDGEGNKLPGYGNFRISVNVACAGNDVTAMSLVNSDAKRITITITDPSSNNYLFSAYRGNF